jgi:hypothetical protein
MSVFIMINHNEMNSTKTVVQRVTDNTTKRQQLSLTVLYVQHKKNIIH